MTASRSFRCECGKDFTRAEPLNGSWWRSEDFICDACWDRIGRAASVTVEPASASGVSP